MNNKSIIKKYMPILLIIVIVGLICFFVGKNIGLNTDITSSNTTVEDVKVEKQTISKTITSNGSIESYSSEKLELSTSYYYDSLYVEEDDIVKKGDKILKYTNGKYLYAPYDLVISKISVPNTNSKASTNNYIQVERIDKLKVNMNISETEISNIKLGTNVSIKLNADSSKNYSGEVTKINSIGTYSSSGTTFEVEVTIVNDSSIKIGMSVSCTISIDEIQDALVVPVNAVQINGDRRYVIVVNGKEKKEVDVTTGLSNDKYVEIKSGLTEGEIVRVVTITKQNTIRNSNNKRDNSSYPNSGGPNGNNYNGEKPSRNFDGGNKPN